MKKPRVLNADIPNHPVEEVTMRPADWNEVLDYVDELESIATIATEMVDKLDRHYNERAGEPERVLGPGLSVQDLMDYSGPLDDDDLN